MALPINTFFDESYYSLNNPDVYSAILKGEISSGYQHFINFGAKDGRNPSDVFDSQYYLSLYPDIAAAVANGSITSAYDHFVQFGAREGRDPSLLFSSSYYLSQNPDVAAVVNNGSFRSGFDHFLAFGANEGRNPSSLFNSNLYLSQNPDVAAAVATGAISAFEHYIRFGKNEQRSGVPADRFNIQFDYRFDTNRFFADPVRRGVLNAAANVWESYIQNEFKDVPAGTSFRFLNPTSGLTQELSLTSDIDDLLIFVGAAPTPFGDLTDALAASATEGYETTGSIYYNRLTGSQFQPFLGTLSFNNTLNWFFDPTLDTSNDIPTGAQDFYSTALHEIAHILGLGGAPIFRQLGEGAQFQGVNAKNINGGSPIPLETDLGHIKDGFLSDGQPTLMDPTYPNSRIIPTRVDLAMLADIGYRIPGFQPQGSLPILSTPNDDVIFGMVQDDVINGNAGNDYLLGDLGADILRGGAGNDIVSGEDDNDILFGDRGNDQLTGGLADDILIGGPGDDALFGGDGRDRFIYDAGRDTIADFRASDDTVQISPALGFANGAAVFNAITTGTTEAGDRYSIVTLTSQNVLSIFHDVPLTAANFTVV